MQCDPGEGVQVHRLAQCSWKRPLTPTLSPHPPSPAKAGFGGQESGEREKKDYAAAVVTPPSTTIVCPVMKVDASEAR